MSEPLAKYVDGASLRFRQTLWRLSYRLCPPHLEHLSGDATAYFPPPNMRGEHQNSQGEQQGRVSAEGGKRCGEKGTRGRAATGIICKNCLSNRESRVCIFLAGCRPV